MLRTVAQRHSIVTSVTVTTRKDAGRGRFGGAVKDRINDKKQFVFASVLNSTLHLNVFGRVNTVLIDKDSQCIYQLSRLSTLSHWSLPWSSGGGQGAGKAGK